MSRSTFRVLFYLKRNAPKKNGLVTMMCCITEDGILFLNMRTHECMNESKYGHNYMRIDEGLVLHSNVPMCEFPVMRSFLNGYKGMCEPTLKSASSSDKPFSEQSSSHTSK